MQIEMLLYPNPTHDLFYVYANRNKFIIALYDLMVKLIFSHNSNQNAISINTQEGTKRYYIVKIISGNIIKTEKLIVQ